MRSTCHEGDLLIYTAGWPSPIPEIEALLLRRTISEVRKLLFGFRACHMFVEAGMTWLPHVLETGYIFRTVRSQIAWRSSLCGVPVLCGPNVHRGCHAGPHVTVHLKETAQLVLDAPL